MTSLAQDLPAVQADPVAVRAEVDQVVSIPIALPSILLLLAILDTPRSQRPYRKATREEDLEFMREVFPKAQLRRAPRRKRPAVRIAREGGRQ